MATRRSRALRGAIAAAILVLFAAGEAAAKDESIWRQIGDGTFDIVVLRPLAFTATVVGTGFFAVSTLILFLQPEKDWDARLETFVIGPGDYTFRRPLGEF